MSRWGVRRPLLQRALANEAQAGQAATQIPVYLTTLSTFPNPRVLALHTGCMMMRQTGGTLSGNLSAVGIWGAGPPHIWRGVERD